MLLTTPKPKLQNPRSNACCIMLFSCGQWCVARTYLIFTCTTHNCSASKQRASFSLARVGGQVVPKHPVSLTYLLVFGRRHGSSKKTLWVEIKSWENEYEKLVDEKCEQYVYHMYPFPYTQILSVLLNTQQATCSHYRNPKFRNSTVHHSHDRAFLHWKVNLSLFIPFSPKVSRNHEALSQKNEEKNVYASHTPEFECSNWDTYAYCTYSDFLGESWLESRERAHPKTKCWLLCK